MNNIYTTQQYKDLYHQQRTSHLGTNLIHQVTATFAKKVADFRER